MRKASLIVASVLVVLLTMTGDRCTFAAEQGDAGSAAATSQVKKLVISEEIHGKYPMVVVSLETGSVEKMEPPTSPNAEVRAKQEQAMMRLFAQADLGVELAVPEFASLGWPEDPPPKYRGTENIGIVDTVDFGSVQTVPRVKRWESEVSFGNKALGSTFVLRTKTGIVYLVRVAAYSKQAMTLEYKIVGREQSANQPSDRTR